MKPGCDAGVAPRPHLGLSGNLDTSCHGLGGRSLGCCNAKAARGCYSEDDTGVTSLHFTSQRWCYFTSLNSHICWKQQDFLTAEDLDVDIPRGQCGLEVLYNPSCAIVGDHQRPRVPKVPSMRRRRLEEGEVYGYIPRVSLTGPRQTHTHTPGWPQVQGR